MAVATIDDLDGTVGATTRNFVLLNGDLMEIDLADKNWDAFQAAYQKALDKYIKAARPRAVAAPTLHRGRPRGKRSVVSTPAGAEQNAAIRAWAQQNNITHNGKAIGNRGRIPEDVVDKFNEAHSTLAQFSHAS